VDAQLPAHSWLATAATAESAAVMAAAAVAVLPALELAGQAAVAVAAAAGKAAAAGLDVVRGGEGPGSRQGVRGPWAGAGSQSCTVENCIFVKMSARLCSYGKSLVLFPNFQSLKIGAKAVFF
jgi:hypothetical protein